MRGPGAGGGGGVAVADGLGDAFGAAGQLYRAANYSTAPWSSPPPPPPPPQRTRA